MLSRERRKVIKERRRIIRVIKVCTQKSQKQEDCAKLLQNARYLITRR